jgi:hypothetical protein
MCWTGFWIGLSIGACLSVIIMGIVQSRFKD